MEFLTHYLLTLLILLPAIGAAFLFAFHNRRWVRWIALGVTVVIFAMSLSFLVTYEWHTPANNATPAYSFRDGAHPTGVVQFVQRIDLIPALHIQYLVGLDGLSLPLVILTAFIFVRATIASWRGMGGPPMSSPQDTGGPAVPRGFPARQFALLLLLESALLGTFLSLNFALFLFFFAVSLLPILSLLRAHTFRRNPLTMLPFTGIMLISVILLLVALIAIYRQAHTFDLIALPEVLRRKFSAGGPLFPFGNAVFLLLAAGFLIRLPVVPFHRWLLGIHVEVPAPLAMVVSAILPATGAYGLLRIAWPLFPDSAISLWLVFAIAGVVTMLYGAFAAMAQPTWRRLVACISIFQMGLLLLGVSVMTAAGIQGATFIIVSHGIIIAMLTALAGVLTARLGHDDLDRLAGLTRRMPIFSAFAAVAFLAGIGLPLLCGFVGEILVLTGAFQAAHPASSIRAAGSGPASVLTIAILGCVSTLVLACGVIWKLQPVFFAPPGDEPEVHDLSPRGVTLLTPMLVAIVLLGLLPTPLFFMFTRTTIEAIVHFENLR